MANKDGKNGFDRGFFAGGPLGTTSPRGMGYKLRSFSGGHFMGKAAKVARDLNKVKLPGGKVLDPMAKHNQRVARAQKKLQQKKRGGDIL